MDAHERVVVHMIPTKGHCKRHDHREVRDDGEPAILARRSGAKIVRRFVRDDAAEVIVHRSDELRDDRDSPERRPPDLHEPLDANRKRDVRHHQRRRGAVLSRIAGTLFEHRFLE